MAGIGVIASEGIAFFVPGLVAAVLWLVRRGDSPFIDDHGREAVNFQISLAILFVVAIVGGVLLCGVGWVFTVPLWFVLAFVGMVMGVLAARDARYFRYPACIRILG